MRQAASNRPPRKKPRRLKRLAGTAFLVVDAVLVTLFVIGYGARYMPPEVLWWTELIAVGLPYLGLVLLPATAVVAVLRRWRLFALHLALLALLALRFFPWPLVDAEDDGTPLSVMTYNLSPWWEYDEQERVREIKWLVQQAAPDVIALQEANVTFRPDRTPHVAAQPYLTVLWDSLAYRPAWPRADGTTYTLQPLLSRVPVLEQTQTLLKRDPDDPKPATRVVRTRFMWEGREVVLYNLHLRTYGEDKPWKAEDRDFLDPAFWIPYLSSYRQSYAIRAWEGREIRTMLEEETLPLIICGDLNSTPHNWVYRHLARGYTDAFRVAGRGWGATYHSRVPFARIDFVFVSDHWAVDDAYTIDAPLSDHRPLVVQLRLRAE